MTDRRVPKRNATREDRSAPARGRMPEQTVKQNCRHQASVGRVERLGIPTIAAKSRRCVAIVTEVAGVRDLDERRDRLPVGVTRPVVKTHRLRAAADHAGPPIRRRAPACPSTVKTLAVIGAA